MKEINFKQFVDAKHLKRYTLVGSKITVWHVLLEILIEQPGPPSNLKIINITGRNATVSWKPAYNGNDLIKAYVVQFKRLTGKKILNLTT